MPAMPRLCSQFLRESSREEEDGVEEVAEVNWLRHIRELPLGGTVVLILLTGQSTA